VLHNHANRAADAYERAVILLRLLLGEEDWGDGYERKVDDCFEMNDGDAVAGWLIEFADSDSHIMHLLLHHRYTRGCLSNWGPYRNAHRPADLFLQTNRNRSNPL
jgi:hypothetical protein